MTTDTEALIEALERAEGPSFTLDCMIFEAVLPGEWCGSKVESWFNDGVYYGCNTANGLRHLQCLKAPAFSASVDSALTLVPEGWCWRLDNARLAYPEADLWGPEWREKRGQRYISCGGRTPAIALCIAALKAREDTP